MESAAGWGIRSECLCPENWRPIVLMGPRGNRLWTLCIPPRTHKHTQLLTHGHDNVFVLVFFRLILGTWTQPRTCGRWSWGTWPSSRYRKHNEDCCHGASSTMFTSIKQTSLIMRPLKCIIVLVESCRNTQSSSKVLKNLKLKSKYFETEYKRWV